MKLDLTKIKRVTNGAVEVIEENGRFRFKRFNKAEDDFYKQTPFYSKSLAPAGIRLEFETDAEKLRLSVEAIEKTSREYFCFEIFVNEIWRLVCQQHLSDRSTVEIHFIAEFFNNF